MSGLGTDDERPGEVAKDTRPRERVGNTTERTQSMTAKKARDRIAQLYLGRIGNEETREIGRARIDWLAEEVRGPSVLDLGCSEGILPILLARRGLQVTGVDHNEEALVYAETLLAEESEEVRGRLRLIHGDLFKETLPQESFDTVVLGETLEHLDDPAGALDIAVGCARPGGRVVLTTPLGYFPDPDHRQTFTLSDIVELLRPRCNPILLKVADGYIRFVGTAGNATRAAWKRFDDSDMLLHTVESALIDLQRRYRSRLDARTELWERSQGDLKRWKQLAARREQRRKEALDSAAKWLAMSDQLKIKRREATEDAAHWRSRAAQFKKALGSSEGLARDRLVEVKKLHTACETALSQAQSQRAKSARLAAKNETLSKNLAAQSARCGRIGGRLQVVRPQFDQFSLDLRRLTQRSNHFQQKLDKIQRSRIHRISNKMIAGAELVRRAMQLPLRLWRRSGASSEFSKPSSERTMPDTINEAAVVERHRRFIAEFNQFRERVAEGDFSHAVIMYGGTTYIQDVRANRPIRLTRSLAKMGIPVLFNFHRLKQTDHIPDYDGGLVFQSPIDKTPGLVERLANTDLGGTRGLFVVSYPHPSVTRLVNLANINGWATLYDCRDEWEEFQKVQMARWYNAAVEKYVVNNCDATCCVSRPLQAKMKRFTSTRPVHLSPNAYDPNFRSDDYEHRPGEPIKIGYFGHLTDRWFDWDALRWIARHRPDYRFEIIGHAAPRKLKVPDNVALLGPKTHPEICEIAASWHVGIITFKVGKLADGVDPIKIYEYFALGLPVVSFRMPQISDYPYTTTVERREEFVEALDRAVETKCEPESFEAFIEQHTWDDRVREMLQWADEALDRPACEKSFHAGLLAGVQA